MHIGYASLLLTPFRNEADLSLNLTNHLALQVASRAPSVTRNWSSSFNSSNVTNLAHRNLKSYHQPKSTRWVVSDRKQYDDESGRIVPKERSAYIWSFEEVKDFLDSCRQDCTIIRGVNSVRMTCITNNICTLPSEMQQQLWECKCICCHGTFV